MKKILIFLIIFLFLPTSFSFSLSENSRIKHNVISITGDDEFTQENGVTGGNGTKDNPYIIENWVIDATNKGNGIYISNTRAYFIIRNCAIYNSSGNSLPYFGWGDIHLSNVKNGIIENNLCSKGSWYGISLYQSSHIILRKNNILKNNYAGIYIYNSSFNTVIENYISENKYGLFISFHSGNNEINRNKIIENENYGVAIWDESCTNNTVYENYFIHNAHSTDKYDSKHIQAIDNGANYWDYKLHGNYWSDWKYEKPYLIDGKAKSEDHYPLMKEESKDNLIFILILSFLLIVAVLILFWILKRR